MSEEAGKLIADIESAFDKVQREDGVTLHQAFAIDCCRSDKDCAKARKLDVETRWQDVPNADLENYPSMVHFLDSKGLRYYLPALMRRTILNYRTTAALTDLSTVSSLIPYTGERNRRIKTERFSLFSDAQRVVVCRFLRFMVRNWGEGGHVDVAEDALDGYWGQFCGG
jgi:hypothetical protein